MLEKDAKRPACEGGPESAPHGRKGASADPGDNGAQLLEGDQFIVGMTKLAPSLMPDGQREVMVLVLV